jgi:hypothetical protein
MKLITRKKSIVALVCVSTLWLAYYFISPLFIVIKLDEEMPKRPARTDTFEILFPVIGTTAHPASGKVRIIEGEGGKLYIRYENFKTINGPDIFVYLAKDLDAEEYVSLGRVKATEGSVNYEIPVGVNIRDYRYVMVWCRAFGVLFNYAELDQAK